MVKWNIKAMDKTKLKWVELHLNMYYSYQIQNKISHLSLLEFFFLFWKQITEISVYFYIKTQNLWRILLSQFCSMDQWQFYKLFYELISNGIQHSLLHFHCSTVLTYSFHFWERYFDMPLNGINEIIKTV